MANPDSNEAFPLGRIASLLVLIAVGLYFTGWTYRWAYFSFFQLDVSTLPLPVESFYMAAFHALLGNPWATLRTGIALISIVVVAGITLWLFERQLLGRIQTKAQQHQSSQLAKKLAPIKRWSRFWHRTDLFIANQLWALQNYGSFQFLRSLIDEVIIVICLLTALFWLARWQAAEDAWLDAVHTTSTLPSISIVSSGNAIPFGFNPSNPTNPDDIRIIGNINAYNNLLATPTDNSDSNLGVISWRLLFDTNGDYYIFPALPADSPRDRRPRILIIPHNDSRGQIILLQPAEL